MSIVFESDITVNGVSFTVEDKEDSKTGIVEQYLPRLYKVDKRGSINCWEVYVRDNLLCRRQWMVGGVVREFEPVKCVAMNVGRANATTPHTQALFEAHSAWKHKIDQCYSTVYPNGQAVPLRPMLAQKYPDRKKYLKFPCGVSPKLDGIRALTYKEDEKVVMESRNGIQYNFLLEIKKCLNKIFDEYPDLILDGEIYSHDIPFNVVSGICRSKNKAHPREDKVEFWIFDVVNDKSYFQRANFLRDLQDKYDLPNLRYVLYDLVEDEKEIQGYHDKFVAAGYEGLIIRNLDGKYEKGFRSNSLLKYKEFEDKEFKVVDVVDGVGVEEGLALFVCQHESGKTFPVRPRGSHEKRRLQFQNRKDYIGKMLTVRYQPIKEDVLPRFPVGIAFRDYE